jgi:uncharacterized membrane protein YdfJ with MMPL/SSD domain
MSLTERIARSSSRHPWRMVLLPAAMVLLGRWNWYLPRWLEWLPRVEVEPAAQVGRA